MHAIKLAGTALVVATAFVVGPRLDRAPQVELASVVVPSSQALRGRIGLGSFGIARLVPAAGPPRAALHVRFTLANTDAVSWRIDLREATVAIDRAPPVRTLAASSAARTLPVVLVLPGERTTIDAFFPVAEGGPPEHFVVSYRIETPSRLFAMDALFVRALVAPHPPAADADASWWLAERGTRIVAVSWPWRTGYEELAPGEEPWPLTDECDEW